MLVTARRWLTRFVLLASTVGLPALASAADDCEHTVRKGDTLSAIAVRHGVREKDLVDTNASLRKNPDLLRIGQTLDVCAAKKKADTRSVGPATSKRSKASTKTSRVRKCGKGGRILEHEVRKGQTLGAIASEHDVAEKEILAQNKSLHDNPNMLRVGQVLEICVDEQRINKSKLCGYNTPLHKHEVVPGEHLGQIAGRYGVRRSDLVRWNASLRNNPNMLKVGSHLAVCPEIAPRERLRIDYSVQRGDTLGSIAKKYDLTPRELERYQQGRLADANALREGQTLVVWTDGGIVPGFGAAESDKGVLKGGVQLPPGSHYHVKWKAAAWGTSTAVRSIQSAVAAYKRKMPGGPKVHVGDLSKQSGGHFPPHVSHQHGRDVDIGYVLKGPDANVTRFRTATSRNLDVARTWTLIKAFIDTQEVTYIFMDYSIQQLLYEHARERGFSEETLDELFQYPRGRGRSHGIIRHWKGHKNHFHVRFRR
jgi:LysM repeat protein